MASEGRMKSGADIIAEYLVRNGVEYVFTLTGHTILSLYEAIRKTNIKLIAVRHEQIAAHAADGYFRASHKPGVIITHVGPGLLNATTGVATAALDSSPLIVISGDAPSVYEGAGPHQEINQVTDLSQFLVYVPFVKRAWRVNHVENIERIMDRAFSISLGGRPGVSLVDVPMDIFCLKTNKYDLFTTEHRINEARFAPDRDLIKKAADYILQHRKILILSGGGVRLSEANKEIEDLSEVLNAPVVTTMGGKGTFPEHNERSLGFLGGWGNPYANKASLEADLIIAIGTRFGEVNSSSWIDGYTFDFSKTDLLRIDIDEKERSKDYPEDMFLLGDAKATVSDLVIELKNRLADRTAQASNWYTELRKGLDNYYMDFMRCEMGGERIKPNYVIRVLQELIDEDRAISLITDVGWSKNGIAQYFRIDDPLNFITPGGLATMGFAPGAALGFKIGAPHRKVIAVVGDGGFTSTISALFTAIQYKIPVVFLVMNNWSFGTIQGLQRSYFNKNFIGTAFTGSGQDLYNPDFTKIAEASGAIGFDVKSGSELKATVKDALNSEMPAVINVPTDLEPDVPITGHWSITDIYAGNVKYMFDRR
ncbi:MAG: thiamine pyrophosphate-binding protein [Thermoplasmata archaeon]